MSEKYEITRKSIEITDREGNTRLLYRIRALRDIPEWGVRAGDIGGYIEKESNLTHDGYAWVKDEAQVYGDAQILGGIVCDVAKVFDTVSSHGVIKLNSVLGGSTTVGKCCHIRGSVQVYDSKLVDSTISGTVSIKRSKIFSSQITGNFSCCSSVLYGVKSAGVVQLQGVWARTCVFDGRGREYGDALTIGSSTGGGRVSLNSGYFTDSRQYLCVQNAFEDTTIGIHRGLKGNPVIYSGRGRPLSPKKFAKSNPYDTRYKSVAELAMTFSAGWRNIDNPTITEDGLLEVPWISSDEIEEYEESE